MSGHPFGTKTSTEPMLMYYEWELQEQKSLKFNFIQEIAFKKCCL